MKRCGGNSATQRGPSKDEYDELVADYGPKRLIQTKARTEEMLRVAMEEGMTSLMQDGIQKCLQGRTTYMEV